jgi:hypothetical protein
MLGKYRLKAGIATEAEFHLLGNGSLARVPAATNINKDIPFTTREWLLTVRGGGYYSVLQKLQKRVHS